MLGVSTQTLLSIEHGAPTVQIGHYARAIWMLEIRDAALGEFNTPSLDADSRGGRSMIHTAPVHVWRPESPAPVLAGEFTHDSVGPVGRFRYDTTYLADRHPALAPDLPLRSRPFAVTGGHGIFPPVHGCRSGCVGAALARAPSGA
jgi:hypothetical protein